MSEFLFDFRPILNSKKLGRQIIMRPAKRSFWQTVGFPLLRKHNIHSNRKTFVRLKWMDFYDCYMIKLLWLLAVIKEKLFGILSCSHALMVLIYYVNSITVPLNICGHYRYYHIIKTRFSMHIVYQLSFWCLAEDLIRRMKTWFLNKLNQDQISWYVCIWTFVFS